ncbi:MAG: DUF3000 domain-containing protein [Actinobacteria bacterium]|nr:DUF3000 domain-containing protein [Actinomycetota bacterium]
MTPRVFEEAVDALASMSWRPELVIEELPAPQKIAPYAVAVGCDVVLHDAELGSGRLVLLHDPEGNASWEGDFRCVTYARADVDPEMVADPLLTDVGWSWLIDALERNQAVYAAPSGTVTAVSSKAFGAIGDDPPRAEVELRASWTPLIERGDQLIQHFQAWSELLCMTAGLPPLPDGVVSLLPRRPGPRSR